MAFASADLSDQTPPCVVLAAGRGQRLSYFTGARPKPLTSLLGLSLAERALLALKEAGVRRFVVAVGHREAEVRCHYQEIAARRGVAIEFVTVRDWQRGNGASALAARERVGDGPFLLTMADHLFSPSVVRRIVEAPRRSGRVLLAVDRDREALLDPEDVTRVRIGGERIVAIGKRLAEWDAADTGLFLCDAALFEGLERAARRGRFTLSAGIAELAAEGSVVAADVTGQWWIDVDTPEALRRARSRLLASLGKGAEDGYVSSWINRRISNRFSALLAATTITPNQITLISFGISLVGAALLALGFFAAAVLGAFLVQLASIVDGCDGEVARLKHMTSARGAWLDTVLDRYSDVAVAIGVTLGEVRRGGDPLVWLAGLMALSGFLLASYVTKEFALRHRHPYPNDWLNRIKRRDLRLFGIFCGALVGEPFAALVMLGVLSHGCVLGILYRGWRAGPATP